VVEYRVRVQRLLILLRVRVQRLLILLRVRVQRLLILLRVQTTEQTYNTDYTTVHRTIMCTVQMIQTTVPINLVYQHGTLYSSAERSTDSIVLIPEILEEYSIKGEYTFINVTDADNEDDYSMLEQYMSRQC